MCALGTPGEFQEAQTVDVGCFHGAVFMAHACACRPSWPVTDVHVLRHVKVYSEARLTEAPGVLPNACSAPGHPAQCLSVCRAHVHPGDLTQGHLSLCMWPSSTGLHERSTQHCCLGRASGRRVAALPARVGTRPPHREGPKVLAFHHAVNTPPGYATCAPISNSAKKGAANRLQEAPGPEPPPITHGLELG